MVLNGEVQNHLVFYTVGGTSSSFAVEKYPSNLRNLFEKRFTAMIHGQFENYPSSSLLYLQ